jgi:hypothetical protein
MTTTVTPVTISDVMPVPKIDYRVIDLRSVSLEMGREKPNAKRKIISANIDGQVVNPTDRFTGSLSSLYGFSENIFKYFDPDEVIERIIDRGAGDKIRVSIQENVDGSHTVLGASKPSKSLITNDDLLYSLLENKVDGKTVTYSDGVVRSQHKPTRMGDVGWSVGGDEMINRFVVDTPIDGYGLPASYLMLIRQVCINGAVAYAKAFKSQINIGNNHKISSLTSPIVTFNRFVESYNNEEGFSVVRSRVETAFKTPASLDEFYGLHRLLSKDSEKNSKIASVMDKMIDLGGDALKIYGIVSLDQLNSKVRRRVPVNCTVYDLMNVATEVGTHYTNVINSRRIDGWVGTLLSNSGGYDLEGAMANNEQPQDLFAEAN